MLPVIADLNKILVHRTLRNLFLINALAEQAKIPKTTIRDWLNVMTLELRKTRKYFSLASLATTVISKLSIRCNQTHRLMKISKDQHYLVKMSKSVTEWDRPIRKYFI